MDNLGYDIKHGAEKLKKNLNYKNINDIDEKTIEKIREWRNLPEIRENMYNNHLINKKEHLEWVKNLKNSKDAFFWVVHDSNTPIGIINLKNVDYKKKTTDWGIYIGEKNYWEKGLSKNILYNLMSHVFDEMNLSKMYTSVLENNSVALNLYKKMGFQKEKVLKNRLVRNDRPIDVYIISIFQEKWNKIRGALKQKYNLEDIKLK